ncbi:MAG TPA: YihY/virulence factor BrkB family protein [Tepidisphaeraceae bacterium]|nr:YihY/virulence factor BrkB family protein [Tepidisphaeraceae bacterium]
MTASSIWSLIKKAYAEFAEDKAMRLAAALACYTILSMAPLVVITMKVATWVLSDNAGLVQEQMSQLVGTEGGKAIAEMITSSKTQNSGLLATLFSLAILLFSASGVFAELQDSLNTVWEVKPRPDMTIMETIKKRFFSMGMVFGIIFLLLVSMAVTSLLSFMVGKVFGSGGPDAGFLAKAAAFVTDFVATVLVVGVLFTLIFKYLPDVKIRFADVWLGGLVTAVLFKIGQYALAIYFTQGAPQSAYGAAGSIVAVLLWAYYSACILFFGAEFTQVYAKQYGHRIVPDEDAVPVTDEERAQHGMPRKQDVQESAGAQANLAGQRGGFPATAYRSGGVPEPRVVTITRPTPEAQKAYTVAGLGLAAGFVVGAIGLMTGRKYTNAGLEQLSLEQRLERIENRFGRGKQLQVRARELAIQERLDQLQARVRHATDTVRRRTKHYAKQPTWLDRLGAMVSRT